MNQMCVQCRQSVSHFVEQMNWENRCTASLYHLKRQSENWCMLHPDCVQSASSLRPVCVQSASSLRPVCVQSMSSLRPVCVKSASSLRPVCFQSASSLLQVCFQSASSLRPVCIQSESSLSPVCVQSAFSLRSVCIQSASSLLPVRLPGGRKRSSISIACKPLTTLRCKYWYYLAFWIDSIFPKNCHFQSGLVV